MRCALSAMFALCVASLMAAAPSTSASAQALFALDRDEVGRIAAGMAMGVPANRETGGKFAVPPMDLLPELTADMAGLRIFQPSPPGIAAPAALSAAVPAAVPGASPPRPDRAVSYFLGARGALREILVRLALWPDERHLVRKDAWGFSLSLQVVRWGDYAAALLTTARGFHFPFVARRAEFPQAFLRLMKTGPVRPSVEPFDLDLGAAGLLAYRAVFELEDTILRALGGAGAEAAAIAAYGSGFTAGEVFDTLSTPSFQALVASDETRWIAGNEVLVAMELSKLAGAKLLARTVVADRPRYSLGSVGLELAGLMFMPETSIRATRLPARLDAPKPELWPLRIVAYDARSSARFVYRPDGSLGLAPLSESDLRNPAWLSDSLGLGGETRGR